MKTIKYGIVFFKIAVIFNSSDFLKLCLVGSRNERFHKVAANAQSFACVWEFGKRQARICCRIKIQKMKIDYVVHLCSVSRDKSSSMFMKLRNITSAQITQNSMLAVSLYVVPDVIDYCRNML